ncbi:unnamed protein product [Diamesa serratosioi]
MSFLRIAQTFINTSTTTPALWNQSRGIKRWVAPTLREIRKRKNKMGPEALTHRSSYTDWNYESELYAFGMRLNEDFNQIKLQQAFTNRSYIVQEEMKQKEVGIENPDIKLVDNSNLSKKGEEIMSEYIVTFLNISLPKYPREGIKAIYKYLMSDDVLANVSSHLGTKDIILSADFPVENSTLASTLKAVVGALFESSGEVKAYEFVRDFVCTQLNQKDINELWTIEKPMELLQELCKDKKLGEPEPRLIGDVGKNTLLAAYNVGIYCNKIMLGSGFGENISIAINEAAKDCLHELFQTKTNMAPFNYKIQTEQVIKALSKRSISSVG